jgi:hypothetical protein
MLSGLRFTLFIALVVILGCGSDVRPYSGEIAILSSPLIATGAWTINGDSATGVQGAVYPIGGFLGALTVTGDAMQAGLTIGSTDTPGSGLPSACLGSGGLTFGVSSGGGMTVGLVATGTVVNGVLTLDGDFAASHLHLVGQLSPDGQRLVSGSYTVTGRCATTAPNLDGHWNAPLTGTYKGQLNSLSGVNPQVTATLTQGSYYSGYGYIPVEGNILFTTAGCATRVQLQGGYLIGDLNILGGYTSSTTYVSGQPANNVLVSGFEDPPSNIMSDISWAYPDSGCGAQTGDPANSGQLVRQ